MWQFFQQHRLKQLPLLYANMGMYVITSRFFKVYLLKFHKLLALTHHSIFSGQHSLCLDTNWNIFLVLVVEHEHLEMAGTKTADVSYREKKQIFILVHKVATRCHYITKTLFFYLLTILKAEHRKIWVKLTWHMWQMGYPNPYKLQESWECTFLIVSTYKNTKWGPKRFFTDQFQND